MKPTTAILPGYRLPSLTVAPMNRATVALFAGASGDHNPIHIDIDFARRVGKSDVFAHGVLSMAYLGRLLTRWVPQSRILRFSVRFSKVVRVGDQLTCQGEVAEIRETDGRPSWLASSCRRQISTAKRR